MISLPLVSFFICVLVLYPVSPSPLFLVLFVTVAINILRTLKRRRRHNEKLYKLRFRLSSTCSHSLCIEFCIYQETVLDVQIQEYLCLRMWLIDHSQCKYFVGVNFTDLLLIIRRHFFTSIDGRQPHSDTRREPAPTDVLTPSLCTSACNPEWNL